jgi:hypothetical protein
MDRNRACEFIRYVSKNGDLHLVSQETLAWAQSLSDSDKIGLYCAIRDESMRLESEWRQEFIQKVNPVATNLPPIQDPADLQ